MLSPRTSIIVVDVVGAKFKGHDSVTFGIKQTIVALLARKLFGLEVMATSLILFIVLSVIVGIVNLVALISLVDLIKEDRNSLTDKEIYLLQQLANKK